MSSDKIDNLIDLTWALDMVDGDVDLLKDVIQEVIEETPGQFAALSQACEEKNAELIEKHAHSFKGTLGCLGEGIAWQLAQDLELMGRHRDLDGVSDKLQALNEVVHQLEQFFSNPGWEQKL